MTTESPRRRTGWPQDLVLGIRLAVGGGRTSLARLVLGTIGIGMATAVLLVAASVGNFLGSEHARELAVIPGDRIVAGVAPLDYFGGGTQFRGTYIGGAYVLATGPNSPLPPGIARLPGPGEVVLSPALAALLASPDGALLRPRFTQRVVGLIGQAGLAGPQVLTFYAGLSAAQIPSDEPPQHVYAFGVRGESAVIGPLLQVLVVIGAVALLVPILIMVSISSRIAGAQRDRRLAALRLVGAGSRQVRRIAAAESLAGASTGLVLGALVFLGFRRIVPNFEAQGLSAFTSDITPPWQLVVLIVLVVPVLSVASALFALRRTVIEPLGVVRGGRPVRRRLWWRAGLVVAGVGLLLFAHEVPTQNLEWTGLVALGAAALLVGVPVLLPWLLERTVSAVRGGPVSWQLAVRRLQLDSGTPARVVGGVAVVLAGAITLQTAVAAAASRFVVSSPQSMPGQFMLHADPAIITRATVALRRSRVVHGLYLTTTVDMTTSLAHWQDGTTPVEIASCDAIRTISGVRDCVDGDVFTLPGRLYVAPGTRLTNFTSSPDFVATATRGGQWTMPAHARLLSGSINLSAVNGAVLVTPKAFTGVTSAPGTAYSRYVGHVDPNLPDGLEYVRNALAGFPLQANVESFDDPAALSVDAKTFVAIRNALLAGSLFTLLLAGVSLLVLALEQVRERRRPLAMLSAAGVSRSALARSLLWQTAVPVGVGVVAATATGIGLAALVLRMSSTPMVLDWTDIGASGGAAVALVLLVTAATLPALRNATRLSALRTE
jgi:hypothetical protein